MDQDIKKDINQNENELSENELNEINGGEGIPPVSENVFAGGMYVARSCPRGRVQLAPILEYTGRCTKCDYLSQDGGSYFCRYLFTRLCNN